MKSEQKAGEKTGLSYELLLVLTLIGPFELIVVHFLVSRLNTTIAWILTVSSVISVALLWVWWFAQRRKTILSLESETLPK